MPHCNLVFNALSVNVLQMRLRSKIQKNQQWSRTQFSTILQLPPPRSQLRVADYIHFDFTRTRLLAKDSVLPHCFLECFFPLSKPLICPILNQWPLIPQFWLVFSLDLGDSERSPVTCHRIAQDSVPAFYTIPLIRVSQFSTLDLQRMTSQPHPHSLKRRLLHLFVGPQFSPATIFKHLALASFFLAHRRFQVLITLSRP